MRSFRWALPVAGALLLLLTACGTPSEQPPLAQKHEVTQAELTRAEELAADSDLELSPEEIAKVANDLQRMEGTYWREAVELDAITSTGPTYRIAYANGVTDTVHAAEDGSGPINILVRDGDHTDAWVFRSSGQIVCNGLSMHTRCRDKQGGDAVLRPIPPALLEQDAPAGVPLLRDSRYENDGSSALQIGGIPVPEGETTLSSRLNLLSVSVADNLSCLTKVSSGEALASAAAEALAEVRDRAAEVLSGHSGPPSYQVYVYTAEGATAYVVDTYANEDFSGERFVWGILEEHAS